MMSAGAGGVVGEVVAVIVKVLGGGWDDYFSECGTSGPKQKGGMTRPVLKAIVDRFLLQPFCDYFCNQSFCLR